VPPAPLGVPLLVAPAAPLPVAGPPPLHFDLLMRYSFAKNAEARADSRRWQEAFLYALFMAILQWHGLVHLVPAGLAHTASAMAQHFRPGVSFITAGLYELHESATHNTFANRHFSPIPVAGGAAAVHMHGRDFVTSAAARAAAHPGARSFVGHPSIDRAAGRDWGATFTAAAAVPSLRFALWDLLAVPAGAVPAGWLAGPFLNTAPLLPRAAVSRFHLEPRHPRYAGLAGFLAALPR
jgi:hypothetical protein